MSPKTWNELIAQLHASDHPCVMAITGGGSSAIGRLLEVPGASRTVLQAVVPYAAQALTEWLGGEPPDQFCSESTARAMAMASWMRARHLAPEHDPRRLVGLGATASLASDRPKRGPHRVHVATQTATATTSWTLELEKGARDRAAEEVLAADVILHVLIIACDIAKIPPPLPLHDSEQFKHRQSAARPEWTELLLGERSHVCYPEELQPRAMLSGSFNPPHAGHRQMVALASEKLACPVAYEISITNVDKPPLDFCEIDERLLLLQREDASAAVILTDAPTFRRKAQLFPGCTFVVGADTMARIADPKYYTGEPGSFDAAIEQIAAYGCRFLVFGRELGGQFCTLAQLHLPPALAKLCESVDADEFREDISSTELRAGNA